MEGNNTMSKDNNQEWDDEWAISSGLPLDDVDAEITKVSFGFNTDISATAICANIEFTNLEDGEATEQSFSVGEGWEIVGKGEAIANPGDNKATRKRGISSRSNYGRLVNSAVQVVGAENMRETLPGGFRQASSWIGTRWHLGTTPVESTNPNTQVKKTRDAIIFTAFLGRGDTPAQGGNKGGGAKAAAGGSKAGAKAAPTSDHGIDQALFDELLAIAMEHDDHDDFMDAVMDRDDVKGDKAVEKVVLSATRKGSVWQAKLAAG